MSRKKIQGTKEKPRLSVFRSNKNIYAQLIDDINCKTISAANSLQLDKKTKAKKAGKETAEEVGKLLAKKARTKKINKIVFDRGRYKYQGRVKKLAEGARKGGLDF